MYVIFNEEDIVQTAVDCIEDLRNQILDYGAEFDQMEPQYSNWNNDLRGKILACLANNLNPSKSIIAIAAAAEEAAAATTT